eukprot:TRINITY_DN567_c0_g1_i1.p1 TRINITY_DN567_c0_g1~~TRINITY_DN567_c0_g1_i1.p1  ORF type:complete len:410 (-),score=103.36 TRINITY_DN567_c0_g1_i1:97-1257(-)
MSSSESSLDTDSQEGHPEQEGDGKHFNICSFCGGNKHEAWECTKSIADLRTQFTEIGACYSIKTTTALHLQTPSYIPPVSPHNLIQECLYSDPWKVLIACLLLNRTSGSQARPALLYLLGKFPTPYDMINANDVDIAEIVRPLGLWKKRTATLKRFSQEYISLEWTLPSELFGVGKYAEDAYKIFCCGKWQEVVPEDHKLNDYHNYLKEINSLKKEEKTEESDKENVVNCSNRESKVQTSNTTEINITTKSSSRQKIKEEKRSRDPQPNTAKSKTKKIKQNTTSPFFTFGSKPKEVIVIEDDENGDTENNNTNHNPTPNNSSNDIKDNNVIVIDSDQEEDEGVVVIENPVFGKFSSSQESLLGTAILGLTLTSPIFTTPLSNSHTM